MNGFSSGPHIPDDIANSDDCGLIKLRHYAASLPYSIESNAEMQRQLELILSRLAQAVKSRDYDYGVLQWDSIFASSVAPTLRLGIRSRLTRRASQVANSQVSASKG